MFPGLDLYCTDPAQPLTTADEELDDILIDHDLSDPSVRGVERSYCCTICVPHAIYHETPFITYRYVLPLCCCVLCTPMYYAV